MRKGWEIKRLGEVLQKTETVNPLASPEVEFEYIDVSSVSNATFRIEETQRLKGKDAPSRARRMVRTNDVLFATIRPTLRRIAIVPEHLDRQVCSTGYFVLRPKAEVDYRFMFHWLFTRSFMDRMEGLQKGASYPAVTDSDVRAQVIPVPPLPDQGRIVGILDEAFAGIAAAKATAERNRDNARAIFESHLNDVFSRKGEGWREKRLDEVFRIGSSKRVLEREWTRSGVPFYGGREVVQLAQTGATQADAYISEGKYHDIVSVYGVPVEGDILMTARGTIGVGYVVRKGDRFYYKDGNLMCLHPKEPTEPRFVLYAFQTPDVKAQLANLTGATVTHLPIEKANSLVVAFPSFSIQQSVVRGLQEVAAETRRLESLYAGKVAGLEELKRSMLHEAFRGGL